jgi:hypothetical protein
MKNFKEEKKMTGEGGTLIMTLLPKKEKEKNREPCRLV